ncbi:hypothetical protein [Methanopyrus sp.]
MIPGGERGFLFTPAAALALALFLLSVSYLSYKGRESGYLIRCEYIKPVINEAVLSMTHQQLSRAVYLGVVDFLNGAQLPGGETNGYRYGRIAVHAGGTNIEWVASPTGLVAPYYLVDVGSLKGDYNSYRIVVESLRYYIDYELAKLAVDVHDSIKQSTKADVWIVPRCYVSGERLYWDRSDPEHPKIRLTQYVRSDPADVSKTPIVPDAHDPFTIYVHLNIHLMAQIPGWETLDLNLGETTVQVSIQGYAPSENGNKAMFDPLPIWAYYVSKYRWGDGPLRFKPMIVIGNYQVAVGQGGSLGGETVGQADVIRFYSAYLNQVNGDGRNSQDYEDKLRLAHVLSISGKMLPWDDTKLIDKNEVNGETESQWIILPYFPVREGNLGGDVGRPPNFIERAAGIMYVLPDSRVVSVDGIIDDSNVEAINECKAGMETPIPTLPAEDVDVWAHGPFGTVDWMAWMEVLASKSDKLRDVIDGVRASEFGAPEYFDDYGEPLRVFRLYGFNSDDPVVQKINSLLAEAGLQLATDADRRKGFALPGADVLKWFLLPNTNTDMVLKNDRVIRVWP